jgi:hypothetical protein
MAAAYHYKMTFDVSSMSTITDHQDHSHPISAAPIRSNHKASALKAAGF